MASQAELTSIDDLSPALWYDYVDHRLAKGIQPCTINRELYDLQDFLRFLAEGGHPVCQALLNLKSLKTGKRLPRDLPAGHLRRLLRQVEAEAASHRQGRMDWAWCLLVLHSGLRSGEVRRLQLGDLDLEGRRLRVEGAKGLSDRVVCLSPEAVAALRAYLAVRGEAVSDHAFIYRHRPLSSRYCASRLHTYGQRCDVRVTPHQLRHSCATLLLNAGASILTVQAMLGHRHVDTTLGYARLYDGTIAAHYYRAMGEVEVHLEAVRSPRGPPANGDQYSQQQKRAADKQTHRLSSAYPHLRLNGPKWLWGRCPLSFRCPSPKGGG